MERNFEWINNYYKVNAEYGREILFKGTRKGVIIQDMGNYIGVNFDDEKPGDVTPLHPTWKVEYLGIVKPRKVSKGRERYLEYLRADSGLKFIEWLKDMPKKSSYQY